MKVFSAAVVGLVMVGLAPAKAAAGQFEDAVLAELNYARTHPADYVRIVRGADANIDGGDGAYLAPASMDDDPQAVAEAVEFLEHQPPEAPLGPNPGLTVSASDHVTAQAADGSLGHGSGEGGFSARLRRAGIWAGLAGENISYGMATPREVVRQLIIDSGVPDRGHRQNIFDPVFEVAGVSCGRHLRYGEMCVIDFAGAMMRR